MFSIRNQGHDIVSTDYFDSPLAAAGLFFLSWHLGQLRILVPDTHRSALPEMQTALMVVVTGGLLPIGESGLEVMFDDGSADPFAITLGISQSDCPALPQGAEFVVSAWTRNGRASSWPARYRQMSRLPCLKPWTHAHAAT